MTAQAAERIILDGRPNILFCDPLYRLCKQFRLDLANPYLTSTDNYRGYVGTWEIRDGRLFLVHLNWNGWNGEEPMADAFRRRVLRAGGSAAFPVHAHWFNGVLRIPRGRQLVYSHFGWSSWYERRRMIHVRQGQIFRDREVDTQAILEWFVRRGACPALEEEARSSPLAPLVWRVEEDEEVSLDDWWPPGYERR